MRYRVLGAVLLSLVGAGCENKYRDQLAPPDMTLPQPDRGPCTKVPPPVLYVRLPIFLREEQRESRYCGPLDRALKQQQLGHAASVGPPPREQSGFSGCAVYSAEVDRALELTRRELKQI